MIKNGFIKRMISFVRAEIESLGGITQNRMVSIKGLYSKPQKEACLVFNLNNGKNQNVIIPIQEPIDGINDNDIILTDGESSVYFDFKNGNLKIMTKNLTIKADSVKFEGGSINHDGIPIDKTHKHAYKQQIKPEHPAVGPELDKKTDTPV